MYLLARLDQEDYGRTRRVHHEDVEDLAIRERQAGVDDRERTCTAGATLASGTMVKPPVRLAIACTRPSRTR
jgi:hypothetical protein